MILIGKFASDAGRKVEEFSPLPDREQTFVSLASLGLDEAKTVGDCTCGSASMLLEVQKHLTTHKVGHFWTGNECYYIQPVRMNMIMHMVRL